MIESVDGVNLTKDAVEFKRLLTVISIISVNIDENRELIDSLESASLCVEKSSAYTTVKWDSKFDYDKRFIIDEVLSRLE